jgi:hypothetical protein
MAVVTLKCPHCLGMSQLRVIGHFIETRKQSDEVSLGAVCPGCTKPVAILARRTVARGNQAVETNFSNAMTNLENSIGPIQSSYLEYVDHWPKPAEPRVPAHLPPAVQKAFVQAENNYPVDGHEESAGLMYRRSLELALGAKYPDLKGSLAENIKKLVSDGVLTSDLGQWATEVRLVGNDAAHAEEVTKGDLEMMRGLAEAVLEYVWTLPTQVQQRRASKLPNTEAVPTST